MKLICGYFCVQMGVLKFLCIARPIYISYHFVITHTDVDHLMWTRCEQFTHIYIQTRGGQYTNYLVISQ